VQAITRLSIITAIMTIKILSKNTLNLDFRMIHTRVRWNEREHAHKTNFSKAYTPIYIFDKKIVRVHAQNLVLLVFTRPFFSTHV
jgi:hypothetical protein